MSTVRLLPLAIAVARLLVGAAPAGAERAESPSLATVFIRVIGTVEVEVKGAFTETTEQRNVELGTGSGFVFTPYGHVLTNHHVIDGGTVSASGGQREAKMELTVDRIEVVFPGLADETGPAPTLDASIEAVDEAQDLAVLSVAGGDLPYLALGDSEASSPGDSVQVYGFPFGASVEVGKANLPDIVPQVSVSRGSVAAARTDDTGNDAYLQTSATVNPGNSGGPMMDEYGYVLGVIRLKLRDGDGIGFAIPVNAVKGFLALNGYDPLLPVSVLSHGFEQTLDGKGLTIQLPDALEDVSPTRVRAFSDPAQSPIVFFADRVYTALETAELEQLLLSGDVFGDFRAEGDVKTVSTPSGLRMGSARGRNASGDPLWIEYALWAFDAEKIVVRFVGPRDDVAFNRSVVIQSLESLTAKPLLTEPLRAPVPMDGVRFEPRPLPAPGSPSVAIPEGWVDEIAAPFPCRGLPPLDSALAASPEGDFTVSFRAGYWHSPMPTTEAAALCSASKGRFGEGSYTYALDWLGVRYVIEGFFVESGAGMLQLEIVSPVEKNSYVRDLAQAWIALTDRPE